MLKKHCRVVSLLLVLVMVLSLASCGKKTEPNPDSDLKKPNEGLSFLNPLNIPTKAEPATMVDTGLALLAAEVNSEINSDAIGWLEVPNTSIDEVVAWYPKDVNSFYLRRDINKKDSWYGTYFADFRSTFNGGREGMSQNTTIYGHSMEDDPNGKAFSQLKKLLDEDFAKKTPYIHFSTVDEDMAWEIFAVYYTTISLDYNNVKYEGAEFDNLMKDVGSRSIYKYDTEVKPTDKIITLSTCCYNFTASYPNNYRYVVMAKLVKPGEQLKTEASFTKNPSPAAP